MNVKLKAAIYTLLCVAGAIIVFGLIALAVVTGWGKILFAGIFIAVIIYLTYKLWLNILKM